MVSSVTAGPGRALWAVAALALAFPGTADAQESVRVRIAAGAASVHLAGARLALGDERAPGDEARVEVRNGRLVWSGRERRGPLPVRAGGDIRLDGRSFPGDLLLVARPDGRLDVINRVDLEIYVESSVASEVFPDWPEEALKAQAVVARTYALYQRERGAHPAYDLEATVVSQRYGVTAPSSGVRRATLSTRGQFLSFQEQPILAVFHASSGGRTASAEEVWGVALPYLRSVESPDDAAPDYFWSYEIELEELGKALREAGFESGDPKGVQVAERSRSGRVERLSLGGTTLSGRELRQVLGGRAIRSTLFDVRSADGAARFLGSGAGHGVGMCQWGAREQALRGRSYAQILAHYYPDTSIERAGAAGARWSGSE